MSDVQIPNLPAATALTGTEQLEAVQAGVSVRVAVSQFTGFFSIPFPSDNLPLMDGTASAGSSALYSRGDHVHPTDTSRYAASNPAGYQTAAQVTASLGPYALINSQVFTGTPSLPTGTIGVTQAPGDNSTKLATTAFVGAATGALGLGTMAVQNANAVAITGGAIDNTVIGGTTRAAGSFTTLAANGAATFTNSLTASPANQSVTFAPSGTGFVTIAPVSAVGSINNMNIGGSVRGTGAFTTLAANGAATFTSSLTASPASANVVMSPTGTGTVTINPATLGHVDNTAVGATTPSTGAFTTLSATGAVTGAGFTTLLSPYALINSQVFTGTPSLPTGTIGVTQSPGDSSTKLATTAFVGAATGALGLGTMATQNANAVAITGGNIDGTIIGATTRAAASFTTLNCNAAATFTNTLLMNASGQSATLSPTGGGTVTIAPGSTVGNINRMNIGATTPGTGAFTTLSASGTVSGAGFTALLAPYLTANQTITLSGDVTGSGTTAIAATVVQLQGRAVAATAPTTGYVLAWSGTQWAPAVNTPTPGGTNGQIQYNNSGALGGITQNGTGNVVMTTNAAGVVFQNTVTVTSQAATNAIAYINKPASGKASTLYGQMAAAIRWGVVLGNATAEGGSNAGSDFSIDNYVDAGTYLGSPITINRASGYSYFNGTGATAVAPEAGPYGHSGIRLNKAGSGKTNSLAAYNNGVLRWSTEFGSTATESGGNAGSDFNLTRFTDAGAFIDTPFSIVRSTGIATFTQPIHENGGGVYINAAASSWATLSLNTPLVTNYGNQIVGSIGTKTRWAILMGNGAAESGGNVGSDFIISRYDDAGTFIDSPIGVLRSNGGVYVNAALGVTGTVSVSGASGYVDAFQGFKGRQGSGGAASGNLWSYDWVTPGQMDMYVGATRIGYISTVSDYRIKKDVAPLPSMWGSVKALRPISYSRKAFGNLFGDDDTPRWGFLAHDLQSALTPSAATGVKDGDEVQSVDLASVVAALTKALQEAMARIEALEARP